MITINTILDMRPGAVPKIIHLSQYDSDFSLVFRLHASFGTLNIENGTTAEIRGTKKSGTGYSASATLNTTNNTVTVTGDAQMTAVAGQNIYEIVLIKNNKVLGSANFVLLVERAALDADTITDATVLRELNAIIEGAETATQAAEDAEAAADRAEAAAQSLVIDQIPTQGSANAVSSGGVYFALQSAGLSEDAKIALLDCFKHVAWIDEHGHTYYNNLYDALYPDTLVYELPSGTDISTHAIDTGVPVFGADDDFTILIKAHMIGLPGDNKTKYIMNHGYLSSGTLRLGVIYNNNLLSYISNVMHGDGTTNITITGETYESDIMYVVRIENKIATKMLYVDGERLVNKTEDISSYLSSKVFTGDYMISAFDNASETDGLFPGIVNLLRIYNKALQDSDIESIMGIQM